MTKELDTALFELPGEYAGFRQFVDKGWNSGRPLPQHPTEVDLSNFVLFRTYIYKCGNNVDEALWDRFVEDFSGWTQQAFDKANNDIIRELRFELRRRGVYVASDKRKVSLNLATAMANFAEWTPADVDTQTRKHGGFHEMSIQVRGDRHRPGPPSSSGPAAPFDTAYDTPLADATVSATKPPAAPIAASSAVSSSSKPFTTVSSTTVPPSTTFLPSTTFPPSATIPPPPFSEVDNSSRLIGDLIRSYHDQDKYGGEKYEFLVKKWELFTSHCEMIGLKSDKRLRAIPILLTGRAHEYYYTQGFPSSKKNEAEILTNIMDHFETENVRQDYLNEWHSITMRAMMSEHPDKTKLECFDIMLARLRRIVPGLTSTSKKEGTMRDQVLRGCRGIPECSLAVYQPNASYEGLCADIRNAITVKALENTHKQQFNTRRFEDDGTNGDDEDNVFWTDRTFGRSRPPPDRGRARGREYRQGRGFGRGNGHHDRGHDARRDGDRHEAASTKKCYVCGKVGCWSTKHTLEERKASYGRYRDNARAMDARPTPEAYHAFLVKFEGLEIGDDDDENERERIEGEEGTFFSELGPLKPIEVLARLDDHAVFHAITGVDRFNPATNDTHTRPPDGTHTCLHVDTDTHPHVDTRVVRHASVGETFTLGRYDDVRFQGILPDTGAAGISTAGEKQATALMRLRPDIHIDRTTAGSHTVHFGKGDATSIGTVDVPTPVGRIRFEVVPTDTPFLLCLRDMDRLGVTLDNLTNTLKTKNGEKFPIIRKWGHPWLLLDDSDTMAWCNLTETELRQLHRRFGHPSVRKLTDVLQRAGHDTNSSILEKITKRCHQCQIHNKAPSRFKFRLRDTDPAFDFNAEIIVDIMYLDGHPVLHVVDAATSFQAARLVKDMSARHVWEALKMCWIDVYQGPPERIVTDAGKNFTSTEFRQNAAALAIDVEEVPVEAHNSIGKVERYHAPLRRAYQIIKSEIPGTTADVILQTAVKAINDTAGPKGLVPTLLVFGSYPRIAATTSPTPSIAQRAQAIQKAMRELKEYQAKRQIGDALGIRNGPNIEDVRKLRPGDEVLVWREAGAWTGPFQLLAITDEECTVQISHGPAKFRITSIRPYHRDPDIADRDNNTAAHQDADTAAHQGPGTAARRDLSTEKESPGNENGQSQLPDDVFTPQPPPPKRKPGRPKGAKNKPKPSTFLSTKEIADFDLATRLRAEGKIATPGRPFEASDKIEIDALIANGIFRFETFDGKRHTGRIFRSRMVREIKNKADGPYEKSRLVIQGFGDNEKETLLTQAPTIQRASQRLILALAPTLFNSADASLSLRDITMAYTQADTNLNRTILSQLPDEIRHLHPPNTIMVVVKPLYGIAEAGTHWWATYSRHHRDKLGMTTSTYDPCLLISSDRSKGFGVIGMQTDDTIMLADRRFHDDEDAQMVFKSKPKQALEATGEIVFNGCRIRRTADTVEMTQKGQGSRIELVTTDSGDMTTKCYVEQRARGAYIASICQPEAAFDLSTAAQTRDPTPADVNALNRRLNWQQANMARGLRFIPIDFDSAALYVFVDGSFANNRDLSSQIGYVIVLGNETPHPTENVIILRGNIVHWSSTKSKRVTRSVLASEVHGMSSGVDIAYALNGTIAQVLARLGRPAIPLIVCTDSLSLYECIVKLGTTREKRLMVDIMAMRQMYEERELVEVRWIAGSSNPADSMTKAVPNGALTSLVDTNELELGIEGWVER